MESSSLLNKKNFQDDNNNMNIKQKVSGKLDQENIPKAEREPIRSIGPVKFQARSSSSRSNKKLPQLQERPAVNDNGDIRGENKNNVLLNGTSYKQYRENQITYNEPISEQQYNDKNNYNNNHLNTKIQRQAKDGMQLEKTAIGDIAVVDSNENDEIVQQEYNNKNNKFLEAENQQELSESAIDEYKSVHDKSAEQTFVTGNKLSVGLKVNGSRANELMQTSLSFNAKQQTVVTSPTLTEISNGAASSLQHYATAKVNRSKKQRRNLPEMKFGHQLENFHLLGAAVALSSPVNTTHMAEEMNDYRKDYFASSDTRTTATENVNMPQRKEETMVESSTDVVIVEAKHRAAGATNPTAITKESAFELYKAEQRNNKRIGHKTHKKRYKDYLRYTWTSGPANDELSVNSRTPTYNQMNVQLNNTMPTDNNKLVAQQHKHAHKLQRENMRGLPSPPIFVITANAQGNMAVVNARNSSLTLHTTSRPFYEGQINYYLETKDDEHGNPWQLNINNNKHDQEQEQQQLEQHTDTSWYRHSPMLRNGLRHTDIQQQYYKQQQTPHQHTHHFSHALHHRHNKHNQYQHKQPSNHHHQHHHHHKHHHRQHKTHTEQHVDNKAEYVNMPTPYPPPAYKLATPNLGHQITDIEDFERYYAKWPHLARVQFQVYDEHLREANQRKQQSEEEYPEYEYDSLAELEEAQQAKTDDENLPPYVRKYNRRNKQLLDLLEGPLPPPKGYHWAGNKLQPGPSESSSNAQIIRLDDDYMREKRRRHQLLYGNNNQQHQQQQQQQQKHKEQQKKEEHNNIFAQQLKKYSQQINNENVTKTPTTTMTPSNINHLPDEEIFNTSMLRSTWQKEMKTELQLPMQLIGNDPQMNWQIEKLHSPASVSTTTIATPKALIFRLPTFNNNYATQTLRQRSRSAHIPATSAQRRHVAGFLDSMELHGFDEQTEHNSDGVVVAVSSSTTTTTSAPSTAYIYAPTPKPTPPRPKLPTMPPRSISAFVYHRVVDNSPRQVGAGAALQGRKQQLPFVAITDRRLETFKKSLLERQKEFEQNNFPPLP